MVATERYRIPGSRDEYLPDPTEPVDRWYQAGNASNAAATVSIVEDLRPADVDVLVDPFAGGGSSAAAARAMGLPFLGIELDPVLACICTAKAVSGPRDGREWIMNPALRDPDRIADVVAVTQVNGPHRDALAVSCLALTFWIRALSGNPMTPDEIIGDLVTVPAAHPNSRVVGGDSTAPASWATLRATECHAVVYTSPPFGVTSPRLEVAPAIRKVARKVLTTAGMWGVDARSTGARYEDLTLAMLHRVTEHLSQATVIIEHEPDDDGDDARGRVTQRINAEFGGVIRDVRILECGAFSRRGALSLIVCEFRR